MTEVLCITQAGDVDALVLEEAQSVVDKKKT